MFNFLVDEGYSINFYYLKVKFEEKKCSLLSDIIALSDISTMTIHRQFIL